MPRLKRVLHYDGGGVANPPPVEPHVQAARLVGFELEVHVAGARVDEAGPPEAGHERRDGGRRPGAALNEHTRPRFRDGRGGAERKCRSS